jgi:hypothetical protein
LKDFLVLLYPLLIFLFPVALYCWALAMVNRRLRPLMVSGPWDFVGLLFAASGFLLIAGPAIFTGLYYRALRELPLAEQDRSVSAVFWELLSNDWALWLAYYLVLLAGVALLLRARRRKTIIYNVDPALFETILIRCLARLGLPWNRQGTRWCVGVATGPAASSAPGTGLPAPAAGQPSTPAILDVEAFPALYHVTLHWRGPLDLRRIELETELTKELADVQTQGNPATTLLLGVSGCLFGLMFFFTVVLILGSFLSHRRW